jgi:hypothetical protein
MGRDCHSEDDFESDEDRVLTAKKQLMTSFEQGIRAFCKPSSKNKPLSLENLDVKPFPAETQSF